MTELTLGELVIRPERYEVTRDGNKINLRRKEYDLLEFLVRNRERILSRLTILEYVWNYNAQIVTNTLEVHISALRQKIDKGFNKKLLHTFHGLGYMLSDKEPNTKDPSNTSSPHQAADPCPLPYPRRSV